MKQESKRPISIEDILRLKRAERPKAEFWTEFDRQLRAKQLAALVAKRPWWHALPRVLAGLARFRIPLGASAVLAISFISIREFRSNDADEALPVQSHAVAAVVASRPENIAPVAEVAPPSPRESVAAVEVATPAPVPLPAEAAPIAVAVAATGDVAPRITPLLGAPTLEPEAEPSPSARHISANLAAVQADPVVSRNLLVAAPRFEPRASMRPAVEPLQQITPPGEKRRSHLLTAMVSMASLDSSQHTAERVASRISEERLYDRERRLGGRGDRVSLKF